MIIHPSRYKPISLKPPKSRARWTIGNPTNSFETSLHHNTRPQRLSSSSTSTNPIIVSRTVTTTASSKSFLNLGKVEDLKDDPKSQFLSSSSLPSIKNPSIQRAYQESIKFLAQDSIKLKERLRELTQRASRPDDDHRSKDYKDLQQLQQREIERLQVLSEINDVQIRAQHSNVGCTPTKQKKLTTDAVDHQSIDMSKPIHRFLAQQNWRQGGRLGRLMETIHRLRVFPDLFPSINPTLDLRVQFLKSNDGQQDLQSGSRVQESSGHDEGDNDYFYRVNVGNFLPSSKSLSPPFVQVQAFHPDPKLYTIVMIDPDVPNPQHHSFTTFLHWLVPNISISATTNGPQDIMDQIRRLSTGTESSGTEVDRSIPTTRVIDYIPPHPAKGSGIHRYTIMMFEQVNRITSKGDEILRECSTNSIDSLDVTITTTANVGGHDHPDHLQRFGFSTRKFKHSFDLQPAGVMSWISGWDPRDADSISSIYRDRLQSPEPRYGPEPKKPSSRTKLPSYTSLPLTHRHPTVIPWRQHTSLGSSNSS